MGLILLYFLVYAPLLHKLNDAQKTYTEIEIEASEVQRVVGDSGNLVLSKTLINEDEFSQVIDEITTIGKVKAIKFISITPNAPQERDSAEFQVIVIEIEAESSYRGIGEFLGELDDLESGVVTVQELTISSDESNASVCKTSLVLHVYLLGV